MDCHVDLEVPKVRHYDFGDYEEAAYKQCQEQQPPRGSCAIGVLGWWRS
jgi:hypothetical protein